MARMVVALAGAGTALLVLSFAPAPLEGNWQTTTIVCMCDSHHFLRFEDGKVFSMSEHHPPPDWIGTYESVGWGKYKVDMFLDIGTAVVRPKLLFLDVFGLFKFTWRDLAFWKTARVLRDPAQEWAQDRGTWNFVVRNAHGQDHLYFGGKEVDPVEAEQIVALLRRGPLTNGISLIVYVGPDGIPTALRDILANLDVEHQERPNQLLHRTQ